MDLDDDGTFPNVLFHPQLDRYRQWWSVRAPLWALGLTGSKTGGTSNVHAEILHNKEKNFDLANQNNMSCPEYAQNFHDIVVADIDSLMRTASVHATKETGIKRRNLRRCFQ